jgi:hypothetical protein
MSNSIFVVVVVMIVMLVFGIIVKRIIARKGEEQTYIVDLMYVWARLGPFENGEQSQDAMISAHLAVFKTEAGDTYAGHSASYDADPRSWEQIRESSLRDSTPAREELLIEAIKIHGQKALEDFNEIMRSTIGREITQETSFDGVIFRTNDIWTPDDRQQREHERDEAIRKGVGGGILNDDSPGAIALRKFLQDHYLLATGNHADNARELGRAYLAALTLATNEPESDFAVEFNALTEYLDDQDNITLNI